MNVQPSIPITPPALKDELSELAERAAALMPQPCSRLEATVNALRLFLHGWDETYEGERPAFIGEEQGGVENPKKVIRVARDMGDWGFTLDELIAVVGPEVIMHPRSYKNTLSKLLRSTGFSRKQVRREGHRPLVWFAPTNN